MVELNIFYCKRSRLVDFSDPSVRPKVKLTEEEEDFLSKTSMFEDFVVSFTDQCLTLIENTSREQVKICTFCY